MGLFNEPLGNTCARLRAGMILLLIVAIARFLAKPAFGLQYADATHFLSLAWLLLILIAVYGVATGRRGGNWKDYLANALILAATTQIIIAVAIALDELGGIDTFYTDPAHGGSLSLLAHMAGHLIGATLALTVFGLLWGWLWGLLGKALAK